MEIIRASQVASARGTDVTPCATFEGKTLSAVLWVPPGRSATDEGPKSTLLSPRADHIGSFSSRIYLE